MNNEKLNILVKKHVSDSTSYWAGRPKLNERELAAVNDFAKKKGEALDKAFSGFNLDTALDTVNKSK